MNEIHYNEKLHHITTLDALMCCILGSIFASFNSCSFQRPRYKMTPSILNQRHINTLK